MKILIKYYLLGLTICCFHIAAIGQTNNPLIGTYKSDHLRSFKESEEIIDKRKDSIVSEITFNADLTFIKVTNGKVYKGNYTLSKHTLRFYLCPQTEKCECYFFIRVPKIGYDLCPNDNTSDLFYPEDMLVRNKKGEEFVTTVWVQYIKVK